MKFDFRKDVPFVVIKDNQLLLYSQTGEVIMGQIGMQLNDYAGDLPTCKVEFVCNIVNSEDEMRKIINNLK